jgi:3-oxoacyl-[acyl-carrier-protein] synthase II
MGVNTSLQPVVITGCGMVTPIGNSADTIVANLRRDVTGIVPAEVDGCLPVMMGQVAHLPGEQKLDSVATSPDRALAFAVSAGIDALAHAGLTVAQLDPRRTATIVGSSKGRIGNFVPADCHSPLAPFNPATVPGDTLGREVARALGYAGGIVLNCPAACATGIVCLIRGVHALQHDEADVVLAGSAESAGRALLLAAFKNMGALAPGLMRSFSADRCGFNPGEGGAIFILERESDARARGARILARVSGWDQRSDAAHITAADATGQVVSHAITRTLQRAGWHPREIDYINAHATATPLNDLVEGRAITRVFGTGCPPVSAIKPSIGHLLGASSAVELAMVLASVRAGYLPPTPHLHHPDPLIPLHFVPPGGTEGNFQRILKLSLGFGGHIGAVALEVIT